MDQNDVKTEVVTLVGKLEEFLAAHSPWVAVGVVVLALALLFAVFR